ncbi:M56 family metallopeptidase [Flagellimonas sp. 2504JD1-5]
MLVYLLKSAACLALLFVFYKIFLESQRMHTFKRFYLIGALVLSLIIPSVVFIEYVTVPISEEFASMNTIETGEIIATKDSPEVPFDFTLLIWPIYFVGLFLFGFKFIQNLAQIIKRIRNNPKQQLEQCTHVLIQEKMPPHTFLKFIFLNRHKWECNDIPNEVLAHEEAHVNEKHSLDVIFIELLQVLLWFNPLIFLFKRAIKLNHEFLADQAVLSKNVDTATYQHTLLAFSNCDNNFHSALSNAINYSSIKKRLTVMKTETSKKSILIRSLLLLPLLSLLLYGFSDKKVIETSGTSQFQLEGVWLTKETEQYAFSIVEKDDSYLYDNGYSVNPIRETQGNYYLENLGRKIPLRIDGNTGILTLFGQNFIMEGQSNRKKFEGQWQTKDKEIELDIQNFTDEFIWLVTIDGRENKFYPKKNEDGFYFTYTNSPWSFSQKNGKIYDSEGRQYFRKQSSKTLAEPSGYVKRNSLTSEELKEYEILAQKHEDNQTGKSRILLEEVERMQELYHQMSEKQRQDVSPYAKIYEQTQQSATREQMAEYNKLAKHYNNMPRNKMRVLLSDVERLRYIYNLMSEKQRQDAEPFPDFPDPPAPPKAPFSKVTAPSSSAKHNIVEVPHIVEVPPPPPPGNRMISPTTPPTPPTPPTPLDHVKKMAAKGGVFYFEGKQISAEKAIKLIKKNKSLNIDSRSDTKNGKPTVKISKDPIIIER